MATRLLKLLLSFARLCWLACLACVVLSCMGLVHAFTLPGKVLGWLAAPRPRDHISELEDPQLREDLMRLNRGSRDYLNANPEIIPVLCRYRKEMYGLYDRYHQWCLQEGLDPELEPAELALTGLTEAQRAVVEEIERGISDVARRYDAFVVECSGMFLA